MNFEMIPSERKRISQLILGNARTLMIVFILFVVVVVMTTDIKLMTISSLKDLGTTFFILLISSYAMYVCCADGGIKNGYETELYRTCTSRFDDLKKKVEEVALTRMNDFCNYYVDEELQRMRMHYLSVACIPYDEYMAKYVKLGNKEIKELTDLTSSQKKQVRKANSVRRIKLTPKMIMTQGRMFQTRSVFSPAPGTMKGIAFGVKFFKMSFVSVCMSLIALDVILEPSWTVFAQVCLKLFTVVINGFDGHKDGYNNITIHTVNYVNIQSSLMQQALKYVEAHPLTND